MVEMAISLPFFVFVLFGMIQWALIFGAELTVRNAAEVGARTAIFYNPGNGNGAIISAAQSSVAPILVPAKATVVASVVSGLNSVTVSYNLPLIIPFVVPNRINNALPLSAEARMK